MRASVLAGVDDSFLAPSANILLVDDNPVLLNTAQGVLRAFGIHAQLAQSGAQAVELVQKQEYDMVFMDYLMPGMDGLEATRLIRALGEKYERLPIIALTGIETDGAKEMLLAGGMNGFLLKPVKKAELAQKLKRWLPASVLTEVPSLPANPIQANRRTGGAGAELQPLHKSTLRLLADKIPQDVDDLRTYLAKGNLQEYKITVHGLKSVLASFGEESLAEEARALEAAVNRSDVVFCANNAEAFAEKLSNFGKQLAASYGRCSGETEPVSVAALQEDARAMLALLRTAMDELDFNGIDTALQELEDGSFCETHREAMDAINENILMAEYEKAVNIIDGLLQ